MEQIWQIYGSAAVLYGITHLSFKSNIYRILLSSPSDLESECVAATEAVHEWNDLNMKREGSGFLPINWKTHTRPELGERPQEIINKQIVRSADILIAFFWMRLGTNTGVAKSGTVEEIDEFLKMKKPILVYISDKPIPENLDLSQQNQERDLTEYKKQLYNEGLIGDFTTASDLKTRLHRHLTLLLPYLKEPLSTENNPPSSSLQLEYLSPSSYISKIVKHSKNIRIIRSGYTPGILNNFVEDIRLGLNATRGKQTKSVKIILPSATNSDAAVRLLAFYHRDPNFFQNTSSSDLVNRAVKDWEKSIKSLRREFNGRHKIELCFTDFPHRYHAYIGDVDAYLGFAWHYTPSMEIKSVHITKENELFSIIDRDFEHHWNVLHSR